MTKKQLRAWLKAKLDEAEPLTSSSIMPDPRDVAVRAAIEVARFSVGDGNFYRQALAVQNPQECATILIDCLVALGP